MNRLLMVLALCCGLLTATAQDKNEENGTAQGVECKGDSLTVKAARKRVAVVLSGGGAKGVAHIGALKVIERAGIPIDIIAGTSMGSIVGGLYACGNDAQTLDSIVRKQDWSFVLSDREDLSHQSLRERKRANTYAFRRSFILGNKHGNRLRRQLRAAEDNEGEQEQSIYAPANLPIRQGGGFIAGKNVSDLFQKLTMPYTDSIDFNQLPIPFACVATNIVDNSEYVFHSGVLAQAMRASMAIPGAFSPVRKGNIVLLDGGLKNNFPVDVAKDMGADIVIGVSVQEKLRPASELNSTTSILLQIVDANTKNKFEENVKMTDIPIMVDTHGYSAASFNKAAIDTLIRRGEEAAMTHWEELQALGKRIAEERGNLQFDNLQFTISQSSNLNPQTSILNTQKSQISALSKRYSIKEVQYENMTKMDALFLRSRYKLNPGDSIDTERADRVATSIRTDLFYKDASYTFATDSTGNSKDAIVTFVGGTKQNSQVNVGLRFDNEEMVALQANTDIRLNTKIPMHADITVRLGQRIKAGASLALHPWSYLRPSLSYVFRHSDLNLYESGVKTYSLTYNQHTADFQLFNFNFRNFNFNIGASWDYYHFNNLLVNYHPEHWMNIPDNEHYYTYHAQMDYNSENTWYFPTRGTRFMAKFAYLTDNFYKLKGEIGMREYSAMWRTSFPLSRKLSVQPMLYGRFIFGSYVPAMLNNFIGGPFFSHYLEQQMPFAGLGFIEEMWEKVAAAQMQVQLNATKNSVILLRVSVAQDAPSLKELMKHQTMIGGSLGYYINTMFGPLGASIGYSNITKNVCYYANLGFEF
ncbi:MAG: patatin-like phospholipase family protein [Prevotella sp.]|nr:patatin-like phospholipase family protein [Prevotella sp.]